MMIRKTTALIPLVLMIAICAALALGLRKDPRILPSTLIDRPLPDFDLPPVREGDVGFKRADVGNQVALINIFGSRCVGCLVEHPTLMRLSDEGRIRLYGVDWHDSREDGARWLQTYGDPYHRVGLDAQSELAIALGVTGMPESYIIDKSGHIRYKQIGPITDEVWEEIIEPVVTTLHNGGP